MMKNLGVRYAMITGLMTFLFVNFIACGSQLYMVSLGDDFEENRVPEEAKNPESQTYGIHASAGWTSLPIEYRFGQGMKDGQKVALQKAIGSWEKISGKQLFVNKGMHQGIDGDSFQDLYSSLSDSFNGYYLDNNWGKTSKPVAVLATTIWDSGRNADQIAKADIRFNNQYYSIGDSLYIHADPNKEVVDMESLALHELGHLLGLSHIDPNIDSLSIMNPQLFIGEGLVSRKLSRGDIERMHQIYGCQGAACNVDQMVREIEQNETTAITTASKSTSTSK